MTQAPSAAPPVPQKNNTLAIVSLVCGIASLVLCGCLAGIPAIICAHIAKKQIAQGQGGGATLAKVGMILGIISIVLTVIVIIIYVAIFGFAIAAGTMPTAQ